jgi:hypothetical protein
VVVETVICRAREHPFDAYADVLIMPMFLPPGGSGFRGRFEARHNLRLGRMLVFPSSWKDKKP